MWIFKKKWIIITALSWLICCQGLFVLIQSSLGQKIIESTQGQFRQELDFSNFNFLARSITDFTTSGSIRCAVLDKIAPETLPILNLKYMGKNCQTSSLFLLGSSFDVKLKSLNGDIYRFQFISNNPFFFDLALWGFRLLGILAIVGIMLAMQLQAERRQLAHQAEIEVAQKLQKMAMQVSHDIRSPLAALKMALEEAESIPAEYRSMVRMSVQRINDIANNLLSSNRDPQTQVRTQTEVELIAPLVDSLVSEKRMNYRNKTNIHIESDLTKSYALFANINSIELKRVLSNLINNSVEAMDSSGQITLSVTQKSEGKILLNLKDNGKGMPEHVLKRLGERGFSHGKTGQASGSGLGFYHAIETIESFGGKLEIQSVLGQGTTISIILNKAPVPSWFIEELVLPEGLRVLILDDDESMLKAWSERLPIKPDIFTSGAEFSQLVNSLPEKNFLALMDYELLGQEHTGLELIKSLGIEKQSILVTSRFEEKELREKCHERGVRLIPKLMAALIPIQFKAQKSEIIAPYDYVYIEDDELMRLSWASKARKQKISLLTLSSILEFEQHKERINKEHTRIYIDSNLGNGEMPGEDFAKILHEQGYKHLSIASGYEAEHFQHFEWLKYAGKNCPF